MNIPHLLVAYVVLALAALGVVGFLSEMRRRRFGPAHPEDRVFRCTKCGLVYTDDADVDRSRCSHCGKLNVPIEF
jgi:protein-arginine kinase activator protein McsA